MNCEMNKKTAIKMCGMMSEADIDTANIIKPEYIGFIFWEKSKRNLSYDIAKSLKSKLDEAIMAVGVFVNADIDYIKKLYNDGIIDIAQLHGTETDDDISKLKAASIPVIKAFEIKTKEDVERARNSIADFVLLDAGKGCGHSFDWSLIKDFDREYFLAGGLDPDNVLEAIGYANPYAVDVSSGIESDGVKDSNKMIKFSYAVRGI